MDVETIFLFYFSIIYLLGSTDTLPALAYQCPTYIGHQYVSDMSPLRVGDEEELKACRKNLRMKISARTALRKKTVNSIFLR